MVDLSFTSEKLRSGLAEQALFAAEKAIKAARRNFSKVWFVGKERGTNAFAWKMNNNQHGRFLTRY